MSACGNRSWRLALEEGSGIPPPRGSLEDFIFSPVTQPTLLVCVPVRVLPDDGEATALDVPIVREYHQGSRFEPGMEHAV
jgi:hypothetical protein